MKVRIYQMLVSPELKHPLDEGLSIKVEVPAPDRKTAIRRQTQYVPGMRMGIKCLGRAPDPAAHTLRHYAKQRLQELKERIGCKS